jgi:hypothetical protein
MWKCNGMTLNKICGKWTDYKEIYCSACQKKRGKNDEALSNGGHIIGTLLDVNSLGVETWDYYEPRPHKK